MMKGLISLFVTMNRLHKIAVFNAVLDHILTHRSPQVIKQIIPWH